ncbi:phage portal protein, partial [Bacillus subtilis]|nr:phage portal protein [Bacillus subtilis]
KATDPRAAHALRVLSCPNDYLTSFEFKKLLTNVYLLRGDVYPFYDGSQLHILNNAYSELTNSGVEKITVAGEVVPGYMVRHIKNIGLSHIEGVGL